MLTKLTIRNFKRFGEVEIELGNPVVFIGPNNSGKTSAMQALTLWDIGVKRWIEKRGGKSVPKKRPGVTLNRRDLLAIPHPSASLMWRNLRIRDVQRVEGRPRTSNVRIDIIVEGVGKAKAWACGLEFDFANVESFYCRPLRLDQSSSPARMAIPPEAGLLSMAFLSPMSGLAATETRLDPGAVNVRIGEGRTAEVLRNLCFRIWDKSPSQWAALVQQIKELFGVDLDSPRYVEERGEIVMSYRERDVALDLSSSGRGLQQTLLLLAYMNANPGAIILLDEPGAHLEILRQRQIYSLISEMAQDSGSQIIAASHSEVLLNEAAEKDLVIAFVGKPHRIGGEQSQVRKALVEIGFDQYYLAEQTGWVLYLEGPTDLKILQAFAKRLGKNSAIQVLERPFVRYVGNQPSAAARHYYGLREALPDLKGVALFDRLDRGVPEDPSLRHLTWRRREIENYFCTKASLENYARASATADALGPLFAGAEVDARLAAMHDAIEEVGEALEVLGKGSSWDHNLKASGEFLTPLFQTYFKKIGFPNLMNKKAFYELVDHIPTHEIDPEIGEKLDAITSIAESAVAATDA